MADDREPTGGSGKRTSTGRRDRRSLLRQGAIAGAAALGAGFVLKGGDKSARAADNDPVYLGYVNTSTLTTEIDHSGGGSDAAVVVRNDTGDGIQSFVNSSYGVYGQASLGNGVVGSTYADGIKAGVLGTSAGRPPTYPALPRDLGDEAGVIGVSYGLSGNGVIGDANTGSNAYGVWGRSTTGYAGFFSGKVTVAGDFTVTGAKSAAVAIADGSLRRLYCMESPESYFEDFGSSALNQGSALVVLEPVFASVVQTDGYQVFLTPEGESQHLYVTDKTATGFTVREAGGGKSAVSFSYRVVAKRRDAVGKRLEPVEAPMEKPSTPLPEPPRRAVPPRNPSSAR